MLSPFLDFVLKLIGVNRTFRKARWLFARVVVIILGISGIFAGIVWQNANSNGKLVQVAITSCFKVADNNYSCSANYEFEGKQYRDVSIRYADDQSIGLHKVRIDPKNPSKLSQNVPVWLPYTVIALSVFIVFGGLRLLIEPRAHAGNRDFSEPAGGPIDPPDHQK